jgi:PAS domain S-box-containing protein
MSLDFVTQFLIGVGYLSALFAIAYLADRGYIRSSIASHPLVYTLSLGVYAGGWSIFGIAVIAAQAGHGYLSHFIGIGGLFLFAPLFLLPLLHICRRHQLTSLADLLAFRYRGAHVGAVATLGMLAASIPMIAAQIKIVTDIASILGNTQPQTNARPYLALVFAAAIIVFAILFGARQISERERHNGLIVTMAFESLVKLAAFLLIGGFAIVHVFGDTTAMAAWLIGEPYLTEVLHEGMRSGSTHILTLAFMAAAIGLPHLFHMALYENPSMRAVSRASWGFPLYLLLLSLPILPIFWAGMKSGLDVPMEYFAAGLGMQFDAPWVALLAFITGLSAASSTIIVLTLALASMTMNNLVLPFYRVGNRGDIYRGLELIRSILIAIIILTAHFFYVSIVPDVSLETLAFSAFIAGAQFLPGALALLYWPRATRNGFLVGLSGGFLVWLLMLIQHGNGELDYAQRFAPLLVADNYWASVIVDSLGLNTLLLAVVSLLGKQGAEEREAAAICSLDNLSGGGRHQFHLRSPAEFIAGLARVLGKPGATREVEKALADLGYGANESRPYALRRLRDRIEANLSRLMGASVSMEIINRSLPYERDDGSGNSGEDLYFVESRLEGYQHYLTGFAAEIDELRRFYRNTLQNLPVGVCGINASNEVVLWNHALELLTGISAPQVLGLKLEQLPEPWGMLTQEFAESVDSHTHPQRVVSGSRILWLSLHKTVAADQQGSGNDARFILLEDATETQLLQQELIHSERLASIGRLAAGVAHEIGNPVTGIDCLAQDMLTESSDPTTLQGARQILVQTHRIDNIVQALVNFAHSGIYSSGVSQSVSIHQCADEAIYLLNLDRGAIPAHFQNTCSPDLTIQTDAQRLLQIFVNLLSNARDATEAGGKILVEARAEGEDIFVLITDWGCGIPKANLEHVFEPFFTTKLPGKGTGLGLSLVSSIVKDMGGDISIRSPIDEESGRGSRVTLRLPKGRDIDADIGAQKQGAG